ncbi:MAG: hypothetical protein JRN52_07385 [Nitrososphaerota archaeon]|nr:hypothetical protein [Nitrososphaerota archaeon]
MTTPKVVEAQLVKQYQEDRYGNLHKALQKAGIETDLYVGIGMEMYHPSEEEKVWCFNAFEDENMIVVCIWPKRLSPDQRKTLKKAKSIARSLDYKVKDYRKLSKNQIEELGLE